MAAAEDDPVVANVENVIASVLKAYGPAKDGDPEQAWQDWSQLCCLACSSEHDSAQVFLGAFTACSNLFSNNDGDYAVVLRMLVLLSRTAHRRDATAARWWSVAVYNSTAMVWIPGLLQIFEGTSHSCRLVAAELFQELVRHNDRFTAAWVTKAQLLDRVLHLVAKGLCHCKHGGSRNQAACMLQDALHHSLAEPRREAGSAVLSCILQHVKTSSHSTTQEAAVILGLMVLQDTQISQNQVRARQLVLSSAGSVLEAFQGHMQDSSLPTAIAVSIAQLIDGLTEYAMTQTAQGLAANATILQQLLCWASNQQSISMDAVSDSPASQDEDRSYASQLAATIVLACLKSPELLSCICSNRRHLVSMGGVLTNIPDPRAALEVLADLMQDKSAWPALADAPGLAAVLSGWISTRLRQAVEDSMASRSAESGPTSDSGADTASSSVLSQGTSAAVAAAALQDSSMSPGPRGPNHQPSAGNASDASKLVAAAGQEVLFGPAQAGSQSLTVALVGPPQQPQQQPPAAQAGPRAHPSWLPRAVQIQEQQLQQQEDILQSMREQQHQQPAGIHVSWMARALEIQVKNVASIQQELQTAQQQLQEWREQQTPAAHHLQEQPAHSTGLSSLEVGDAVSDAQALAQQPAAQQPEAECHAGADSAAEAQQPEAATPTASLAGIGGATGSGASEGADLDRPGLGEPVGGGCPSGSQAGGLSPSESDSAASGDLVERLRRRHNLGLAVSSLHGHAIKLLLGLFPFFARSVQQQLAADAGILQRLEGILVDRNRMFHPADIKVWQSAVNLLEKLLRADMQAVLDKASTSPVLWLGRLMDYLLQSPGLAEYVDPTSCLRTLARSRIAAAHIGSRHDILQLLEWLAEKLPYFRETLGKSEDQPLPCWKALPQILQQLLKTAPGLGGQLQRECWKALCEELDLNIAPAQAASGAPSSAAEAAAESATVLHIPAAAEAGHASASASAAAVVLPAAEASGGPRASSAAAALLPAASVDTEAAAAALKAATNGLDAPPAAQAAGAADAATTAAAGEASGSQGRVLLKMQSGNEAQASEQARPSKPAQTHPAGHLRFRLKARQQSSALNMQHNVKPGELSRAGQQSRFGLEAQQAAGAAGQLYSSTASNSSTRAAASQAGLKPGSLPMQPAAAAGAAQLAKRIGNAGNASSSREAAVAAAQQAELGALTACKQQQQELADKEQQAAPSPDALKAHGHGPRALTYSTESARGLSCLPAMKQPLHSVLKTTKTSAKLLLSGLQPAADPAYRQITDTNQVPDDVKRGLQRKPVTVSCSLWGKAWAYGQGHTVQEAEEDAALSTAAAMRVCGIQFPGIQPCPKRPR